MRNTIKYIVSGIALGAALVGGYTAGRVNGYEAGVEAGREYVIQRIIDSAEDRISHHENSIGLSETQIAYGLDVKNNERETIEDRASIGAIERMLKAIPK